MHAVWIRRAKLKVILQGRLSKPKEGYYDISPQEAKKRLDSEKDIILLDVRTVEEYTEKHIPKSFTNSSNGYRKGRSC